jgi:hypothetical protein
MDGDGSCMHLHRVHAEDSARRSNNCAWHHAKPAAALMGTVIDAFGSNARQAHSERVLFCCHLEP